MIFFNLPYCLFNFVLVFFPPPFFRMYTYLQKSNLNKKKDIFLRRGLQGPTESEPDFCTE